ncbi:MAG: acetate--CoA ligase family protein [Burkholderiaceae bacterium]
MIRALSALAWLARAPSPADGDGPGGVAGSGPIATRVTHERDALQLLSAAGLPVVPSALAVSADQAVAAAGRIGYPVVAKIVSADILHKTDVGGVSLDLRDEQAVRDAYATVTANAARHAPKAAIDGVLIAPMVRGGIECILGVQQDPAFGPVVMFGLGGILVDALKDVSFRAAPFGRDEALSMIREIRGYPVLTGLRGAPPADIDALADALVALSSFAAAAGPSMQSLDINPMLVRAKGEGVMALDAVIVGQGAAR